MNLIKLFWYYRSWCIFL